MASESRATQPSILKHYIAQSAGVVEYTDCFSVEG